MQFPKAERYKYNKNPLREVICQLRFPTILKIETDAPSDFQDGIRDQFPLYDRLMQQEQNVEVNAVDNAFPNTLVTLKNTPNHTFESRDHFWRINLTSDFIAISTHSYSTWEEFKESFEKPLKLFIELYRPAFFTRIGLRYIDAIDRNELDLANVGWGELLNPMMAGMLAINDTPGMKVTQTNQQSEIQLNAEATMVIRTGLGLIDGIKDELFVIDTDTFSTGESEPNGTLLAKLDALHEPVSRYFRWAITDRLHDAMAPEKLEAS